MLTGFRLCLKTMGFSHEVNLDKRIRFAIGYQCGCRIGVALKKGHRSFILVTPTDCRFSYRMSLTAVVVAIWAANVVEVYSTAIFRLWNGCGRDQNAVDVSLSECHDAVFLGGYTYQFC